MSSADLSRLPQIIALCSLKGGAGKSMFSGQLAAVLSQHGKAVVVLDCDNEGSMLSAQREAANSGVPLPFPVEVGTRDGYKRRARELAEAGNMVIIDTPGNSRELLTGAALVADLVVVPVSPSEFDIDRLGGLLEVLDDLLVVKPNLNYRLVLNRYDGLADARSLDKVLDGHGLPRFQQVIKEWTVYRKFVRGQVPDKAADPFRALLLEMLDMEVQA